MPYEQPAHHQWQRFADLPPDWRLLVRTDLTRAVEAWHREQDYLKHPNRVARLQERLASEWAIETGSIERLYAIDRGVTESLIELGLGALDQFSTTGRVSLSAKVLIEDQRAALDFVFAFVKDERDLTLSFIKELHQLLCRHQDTTEALDQFGNKMNVALLRGAWKMHPNNPTRPDGAVHQYCPPEFVQDEMERLVRLHADHSALGVPPEVEAAWLHHRFAQVHPFQDGNGRVARALATMVFLKGGFLPLVVRDVRHRNAYLDALEAADRNGLRPLVDLFSDIEAADLEQAVTFIREIQTEDMAVLIGAAAETVERRRGTGRERDDERLAASLLDVAAEKLTGLRDRLEAGFADRGLAIHAAVIRPDPADLRDWDGYVDRLARTRFFYVADLASSHSWVGLNVDVDTFAPTEFSLVISVHHAASRTRPLTALAFLGRHDGFSVGEAASDGSDAYVLTLGPGPDSAARFQSWLDEALLALVNAWQSSL